MVMLELSRRNEIGSDAVTNRIPLHITDVSINTNKTVPNMGVPLSGAVRGESLNLAFDMGLSQKTVSLTGVLLEQNIVKQSKDGDANKKNVTLPSFELMQLLHSYVASSSLQDDHNINKILFFYPSKVTNTFDQRTAPPPSGRGGVVPGSGPNPSDGRATTINCANHMQCACHRRG